MEEKDLFRKINKESENNLPDVYDRILFAAYAEGLLNNDDNAEAYSDGETVALGGVNKKAIAVTTLAALAAVSLAITLPVALSGKYDGGLNNPPLGNGDNKIVADIDLGDSYAYGAVTTARLAESFLGEPAGAKAMAKRSVSENDFQAFGTYFSALDCYLESGLSQAVATPSKDYQKSITISGRRVSGNLVDYSMYYTEYKIVKQDYVTGNPVNYYLEGEIIVAGYKAINLVGERTLASDAEGAEETAFNVYAYPNLNDKTTYVQMKLGFEEIDGVTVRSYSYKVVSKDGTLSEAVSYKTDDAGLVIKIKEGADESVFTVTDEKTDGGYKGSFDFGKERGEFTVKCTDNGFKYELPDPAEENSFLGYKDNGNGTYSVSTYDKNATLPDTLVIPSTYNGKPVVSICEGAFKNSAISKVVISEGITAIDKSAFEGCGKLTEIELPATLEVIRSRAFFHCWSLAEVTLPENVVHIGDEAFSSCSILTGVTLPSQLEWIGWSAFNSTRLTSVSIPASVYYIGTGAFSGCHALESLTVDVDNIVYYSVDNCIIYTEDKILVAGCKTSVIPADGSVTELGPDAFYSMGLMEITVPGTITKLGVASLGANGFTSVALPEGLLEIDEAAFINCNQLTEITLPSTLERIGDSAFVCCGLTSINVPANVSNIGTRVFNNCPDLSQMTVDGNNAIYHSDGNCIIDTENKTVIAGCKTSVIPADGSVEVIGPYAFAVVEFTSLTIPDSVWLIDNNAFMTCEITSIVLSKNLRQIDDYAFNGCNLTSIVLPEGLTMLGNGVFYFCIDLEEIVLPSTLTEIGSDVFDNCSALKTVVISKGITCLNRQMFRNCESLETITIPKTVTVIDFQALYGCMNLQEINFTGTMSEWEAIQKDGETWNWDTGDYVVKCTDGTLAKDGTVIN